MSADNYLLVTRHPKDGGPINVFHLFASEDEIDLDAKRPMFMTTGPDGPERALRWAADWCKENICEYGVSWTDDIWDVPNQDTRDS